MLERVELGLDFTPEMRGRLGGRERTAPPGKAQDERAQRPLPRLEEGLRQPGWRHRPERVAVAT